jgi:hypothetical protein
MRDEGGARLLVRRRPGAVLCCAGRAARSEYGSDARG